MEISQSGVKQLRSYQIAAARAARNRNAIIVLPTGAGKTLVASFLAKEMAQHSYRTLFLVPSKALVHQQAASLRLDTRCDVAEHRGQKRPPGSNDFMILVSTPEAFRRLLLSEVPWFRLTAFGLVVFDEVHHTRKEHPYALLADALSELPSRSRPRVLGLSATLAFSVDDIEKDMANLKELLNIEVIYKPTHEELIAGGYTAMETRQERTDIFPRDYDNPLPRNGNEIEDFFSRVKLRQLHKLTVALIRMVKLLEKNVVLLYPGYTSPLLPSSKPVEWGKYAHEFANSAAKGHRILLFELEHYFEALRISVTSRESLLDFSYHFLEMRSRTFPPPTSREYLHPSLEPYISDEFLSLSRECSTFLSSRRDRPNSSSKSRFPSFTRIKWLKEVIIEQLRLKPDLHLIVFVKQKFVALVIHHVLENDESFPLTTAINYSSGKNATPSLSFSPTKQKEALSQFRNKMARLLITTNVVEEGFDVSSANCVIRFDPIETLVSHAQGRGRAREDHSTYIVLSEMGQKNASHWKIAERIMDNTIKALCNNFSPNTIFCPPNLPPYIPSNPPPLSQRLHRRLVSPNDQSHPAQFNYPTNIQSSNSFSRSTVAVANGRNSAGELHEFVQRNIGAALSPPQFTPISQNVAQDGWICNLELSYRGRRVIGRGQAMKKNEAKALASMDILEKLRSGSR